MSDETILITGGTGMIGGSVLSILLRNGMRVHAIARAPTDFDAAEKLRARLLKSGTAARDLRRLAAHAGNTTSERLGLPSRFKAPISVIVHAAGETAFNDDQACWNTNVEGALRVLEFARSLSPVPRILFISTASVCMGPRHSELTEETAYGGFENGYTRSKRGAERLFAQSGLDVVILRPSIVFSRGIQDRRMARSMLWVIPALIELGEAPIGAESRIDIAPVDFVAESVARLLERTNLKHRCYHISAGMKGSASCSEIRDAIREVYPDAAKVGLSRGNGSRSRPSTPREALRQRLMSSVSFYLPFLNADIAYSNARITAELGPDMPRCPKVTEYINDLLGQFGMSEALDESCRP